jgi:choline dehydrogenase-like flavoprotein
MASSASDHDICVVGSGIAAMMFAERVMTAGRRVLLLERGNEYTFADRLRRGRHEDPLPFNRSDQRLRHGTRGIGSYLFNPVYNLGGSTNHFYGNTPRFHPSHFEMGAFGGLERAWPVSYAALEPHYLAAERRLQVSGNSARTPFPGRFDYPLPPHAASPSDLACEKIFGPASVMQVPTVRPSVPVDGRPQCCASDHCVLCPIDSKGTALNTVYPAIREQVELRSGLLATELHVRGRRVEGITVVDREGNRSRVTARHVVVAANGVDSCLLLQRSDGVPKHPTLGRCYMDHPAFELAIYGTGLDTRPGYGNSAQTGMITTFFERTADALPVSLLGEIRFADPVNLRHVRDVVTADVAGLALRSQYSSAATVRARFEEIWRSTLYLKFLVETQPLMENTLSIAEIRPSGQAIPAIALRLPAYFRDCMRHVRADLASRLPRATIKHVATRPGVHHWMGATRMADNPRDGSVDANLRYHGLDNLSVLSASTFPSCSSANPTLTLCALALRLGDHLATS